MELNLESITQGKLSLPRSRPCKEDAGELGHLILESEVKMSRCLTTEIGDFPLHPDHPNPLFQEVGDPMGQFTNGQNGGLFLPSIHILRFRNGILFLNGYHGNWGCSRRNGFFLIGSWLRSVTPLRRRLQLGKDHSHVEAELLRIFFGGFTAHRI